MTDQPVTKAQLDALERAADKVFGKLGIDIEFTRHFLDRVNDERNRKQITIKELGMLFVKEYKKWGRKIANMPIDAEAVMKDLSSEINVPFVLNKDGNEKDLVAKTVMRKKNFKTPDPELPVESVNEATIGSTAQKIAAELNKAAGFDNEVFQVFGSSGKGTGPAGFGGRDTGNTIKWMTYGAKNRAEEQGVDIEDVAREAKAAVKQWFQANGYKPQKFRDIDTNTTETYYIKGPIAVKHLGYFLRVNSKRMLQNKNRFKAVESVNEDKQELRAGDIRKLNSVGTWRVIVRNKNGSYQDPITAQKVHMYDKLMGLGYEIAAQDWAAHIEGLREETHGAKKGTQVKGRDATPKKSKPTAGNETPHPMRGKLVGEEIVNERWKQNIWGGTTTDGHNFKVDKLEGVSETEIQAAWESYQVDEVIVDPREAILLKALKYLDHKIKQGGKRQSVGGYAYEVGREVQLDQIGMNTKDLAQLYRDWKGDTPVTEGWMESNLYYLDEVINNEDEHSESKGQKQVNEKVARKQKTAKK